MRAATSMDRLLEEIHGVEDDEPYVAPTDRRLTEEQRETAAQIEREDGRVAAEVYRHTVKASRPALPMIRDPETIQDIIADVKVLDEDQFARTGFKVSSYAAQRVRENPVLRELLQADADGDDPEKSEIAEKILQAAKDFKYR